MDPQRTTSPDLGFEHVYEPGSGPWTLLLLHGTGGDEHDLVGLGRQLSPSAALLSPRGKVSENGAPRFFRRLAVGRLDIPDLLARTDELADFVAAAATEYRLDARRVVAVGFSNGANIAASLLLRRPEVLRGAALLRPMLPYEPDLKPGLTGTDVLVDAGEHDPYVSVEQTHRLAEVLGAAGADVTLHLEKGAGHNLTQNDLARVAAWTARVLGGQAADGAVR
jgi:predicted esterase